MKKRIILVGKAASGKDYFKDFMRDQGYTCDVSYTSRPKREGEIEGETYHYITEEKFQELEKEGVFYEAVTFNDWRYGTTVEDWEQKKLCIKTPSGIAQLTEEDIQDSVIVFFDIPLENRRERLMKRSDADKVDRRIASDEEDFKDFKTFNIRVTNPLYNKWVLETLLFDFQQL